MLREDDLQESFDLLGRRMGTRRPTALTEHIFTVAGSVSAFLGQWLDERGLYDEAVILTKGAHHTGNKNKVTPPDITADLTTSLERCRTNFYRHLRIAPR